jgi:hypothetical protein
MQSSLARVLLSKGVIRQGTVIESYQNVRGLSCVRNANVLSKFVIVRACLINGHNIVFDSLAADQTPCRLTSEQVISLDGMLIERIATSHNLTLSGEQLSNRTRRGRRRKNANLPAIRTCDRFA